MKNSFPRQGDHCPICKDRAIKHKQIQEQWLDAGDALLQEAIAKGAEIKLSDHTNIRSVERCFSMHALISAIEAGVVIERQIRKGKIVWLISSNIKLGPGKYRPVHTAVSIENDSIYIVTVYDPRSHAWKWDNTYTERRCWCQDKKNEV